MSAKLEQPAQRSLTPRDELEDLRREWRGIIEQTSVKLAGLRARELQLIAEIRKQEGVEIEPISGPIPGADDNVATNARANKPIPPTKRLKGKRALSKRTGRPREIDHPLTPHIPGGNLSAFAASEGLAFARVYGWGRADDAGRQIPEYWAKKWEKTFGIPLDAWPKGVRAAK